MAKITNLDELKTLHSEARRRGASSREWIEFAIAMEDSFPAIYDKAKVMNAEFERLREIELAAKNLIAQKGRHNTETAYKRLSDLLVTPNVK